MEEHIKMDIETFENYLSRVYISICDEESNIEKKLYNAQTEFGKALTDNNYDMTHPLVIEAKQKVEILNCTYLAIKRISHAEAHKISELTKEAYKEFSYITKGTKT